MFHESIFPLKNDKLEHYAEEEETIKYHCETCYEEHHADQTLDSIPVIGLDLVIIRIMTTMTSVIFKTSTTTKISCQTSLITVKKTHVLTQ